MNLSPRRPGGGVALASAAALNLILGLDADAATRRLTAEAITRSEASTNISRTLWRPPGNQVSFIRPVGRDGVTNSVLCAYDIADGREVILFDPSNGETKPRLSISGYQWSADGSAILVTGGGDLHAVEIPGGRVRRLTKDGEAKEAVTWSPDGARIAYVSKANLFTVHVASGRRTQLTFDGGEVILNGILDWVYNEEFDTVTGTPRAYRWAPDGRSIAFLRLDQSRVPVYPITDYLRTHPTVQRQRYPKSGHTNAAPAVFVVDVAAPRTPKRMALDTNIEYVLPEFHWTADSKTLGVMTLNRTQNELTVLAWDPGTRGRPRACLIDHDRTWINAFNSLRFLRKSTDFLWVSERDGWLHCYRHARELSAAPRQLTRGPWQIEASISLGWSGAPVEVDPAEEWIYFSATEKDPRERHVYRVRLDGTDFTRLTTEAGTHFQKLSPDGCHLLVSSSTSDRPTAIRLLRADGSLVATLDQRADRWRDFAMPRTEFHEVTARDGTKLFAQLTKPIDFDSAKKYPVIVYVYGGPHAQVVRNVSGQVSTRNQLLAEHGFLVWSLDNRGSWGRGHAWESTIFKNCGTNELLDQLDGLAYLRKLPFVDTNRFGVWGWSYGGYMTLYALTHAPDAFRCGVAGAPVTDWKFYDTIYTERYMSTPKENPSGYKTSSPLAAADRLKSRVLVIHGTADDNVHMQNTMNFIDALAKKGKPYELQIQPGQMHGFSGEAQNRFLVEQILEFFKRNL
jgi:dipeptidyl-peptidase-4